MAKSVFVEKKRQWEKACVPVLIIRVGLSFSLLVGSSPSSHHNRLLVYLLLSGTYMIKFHYSSLDSCPSNERIILRYKTEYFYYIETENLA